MAQYLSFIVNKKSFLFDIEQVHSIIIKSAKDILTLPEAPVFFVGLTQLREKTIGILSASILFESKQHTLSDNYNIVIIKVKNELYGIIVDAINGVKNIDVNKITSNVMMMDLNQYVLGVYNDNNDLHLVIDANKLIEIKQVDSIK